MFLNSDHVSVGSNPFHFLSDASELGLPPGAGYPTEIATSLGNKLPFRLVKADAFLADYVQDLGCAKLTIFND